MTGDSHAHAHAHDHGHAHLGGTVAHPAQELAGIVAMLGDARGRVLDIGCGAGADIAYLASLGFDAVAVDASAERIEDAARRAAQLGVSVELHVASATALPLADASIDLAFDRGCLHHVPAGEHPRYVAELARVLAPGGRAFLRDAVHPGQYDTPVNAEAMARLVTGSPLAVETGVPFTMHGHGGYVDANLVVLRRR